MFDGASLLITGGTGSFGHAVLRRFLKTSVREIRILSRDEKKQDDMRKRFNEPKLKFHLGDVRDHRAVSAAMTGVDYVFHAAALKQVPSCEFYPMEAVKTNVLGTENVIDAAVAKGVKRVICLSTDKAVYPINAMGISKAMMEKVMAAKSRMLESTSTVVCATRYGNVMASRGSVIPLFSEQLRAGKPLTVTDPKMTRFMMSLEDAVELVLYAFQNGGNGDIFVQKAPAATIGVLVKALLEVLGQSQHPVEVMGTRHGEKLYETLLSREEMAAAEDRGDYFRVPPDLRDLNYGKFVETGSRTLSDSEDYNSHNTTQLDVAGMAAMLRKLPYIQALLGGRGSQPEDSMRVLITGSGGFLARNLAVLLRERKTLDVRGLDRDASEQDWQREVPAADFIFHLAGVNRPKDPAEFASGNAGLTQRLCALLAAAGRRTPVVLASSTQAASDNPYGRSKRAAEEVLSAHGAATGAPVHVYRLPNLFGKWGKPNYNSAVATFCHNLSRDLPIRVDDPSAPLTLAYVDDVVAEFVQRLDAPASPGGLREVSPLYRTTVGEVADLLRGFREGRQTLFTERVGTGFTRALYATYVSYLPTEQFGYAIPSYSDPRGTFAEMLKTRDSGQFSFFTAHPGVTRGGHYHHTKTEKFLVLQGEARYRFRHMLTGETHEILSSGRQPLIVETVPGWTHDITNVGQDEMIVMLWANEVFDRQRPDTYVCPL